MKRFKLKALAALAGAVFAAFAGSAGATAIPGTNQTSGSDLFLAVWTTGTTGVGYVRDLGITNQSFTTNDPLGLSSFTNPGDSTFTSLFTPGTVLNWAVTAGKNFLGVRSIVDTFSTTGASLPLASYTAALAALNTYIGSVNNVANCNVAFTATVCATNSTASLAWPGIAQYDGTLNGTINGAGFTQGGTGTLGGSPLSLGFFSLNTAGTNSPTAGGTITLAADGTVVYTAAQAGAVPLPAAGWLFGSGLLALGAMIRRRLNT
jgi:hypothetical protein